MRKRGIHRVLVMDGKKLAGIISAIDIARAVSRGGLPTKK
jgi:CBS domain.